MSTPGTKTRTETCRRCGSCCRSCPPALHGEDKELYVRSEVGRQHLVTFRQGERVFDNVRNKVLTLDREMVRIRSLPRGKTCIFFEPEQRACRIYPKRPLECRVFACWDPQDLLVTYAKDRVQRMDLVSSHSALGQIIAEHEKMCPWDRVMDLLPGVQRDPVSVQAQELARILNADQGMRQGLQEQAGALEAELDFILGRSMSAVLPGLGLSVRRTGDGYSFQSRSGILR
ncbi:MAG: YkgJ family cysteine cluster protein [Desulfovermiculus sp.]